MNKPNLKALKQISEILAKLKDKDEVLLLMKELLTDKELENLALRWLILNEISMDIPQRKIAEKFHLSLCKITRGSKILKTKNSVCKKILNNKK
ncbi:MAG: Trp family transcriptional regulator [Candidatus Omnitrophica bacterium]|jgi:TrpR family trp operon transcriptional repressor|nr:Trp family transcriptional regulator [Candidatus Omnitrophota bacterium]MDD5080644.1 Trp family transcriptional regulator [Candidatus Omnitrophota bacterium]MDD5440847.1 Trp family transcriptional regulator [Candidatus Omnitrophota bacterium]